MEVLEYRRRHATRRLCREAKMKKKIGSEWKTQHLVLGEGNRGGGWNGWDSTYREFDVTMKINQMTD